MVIGGSYTFGLHRSWKAVVSKVSTINGQMATGKWSRVSRNAIAFATLLQCGISPFPSIPFHSLRLCHFAIVLVCLMSLLFVSLLFMVFGGFCCYYYCCGVPLYEHLLFFSFFIIFLFFVSILDSVHRGLTRQKCICFMQIHKETTAKQKQTKSHVSTANAMQSTVYIWRFVLFINFRLFWPLFVYLENDIC